VVWGIGGIVGTDVCIDGDFVCVVDNCTVIVCEWIVVGGSVRRSYFDTVFVLAVVCDFFRVCIVVCASCI